MPDRVHPTPRSEAGEKKLSNNHLSPPPQGGFVSILIRPGKPQFPIAEILRYLAPLDKAHNHGHKLRLAPCLCCLLIILVIIITIAGMLGAVFYSVYLPKAPKYSIDSISIHGFNVTSASTFSPRMDVTVRAHNPNNKISIYYAKGSSIQVSHSDTGELCTGVLPVFYQPTNNITIFQAQLRSTDSKILKTYYKTLMNQEKKKQIPLNMGMKARVKIKFGSIKTWAATFKVRCRITVNSFTKNASILHKDCSVNFKPWE